MRTHFIADMHFGAEPLARRRGFGSAAAMNMAIEESWRERVKAHDIVWIVGDVGDPAPLARLPGVKHLVLGNTDVPFAKYCGSDHFASVTKATEIASATGMLLLVHRPSNARPAGHRAVVHGHIHEASWGDPLFVCVSVDQTGWGPITTEEVLARLEP